MKPILEQNTARDRKIVIALQLSVLVFILIGLLGSALIPEPKPEVTVNLDEVMVTKPVPSAENFADLTLQAGAVYVWDVKQERVLFEKNADKALPLASITKLMTSLLAYELVSESKPTKISQQALNQDGSTGFVEGEELTLENLNRLALISSSNDAAFALAASVGAALGDKDPAGQFVAGMNLRARELGLDSLEFKNPTGLDVSLTEPGATGSAADVSRLVAYILDQYPELVEPTQDGGARVYSESGQVHDVDNTNQVLYMIPNLLASKTGYTDLAGGNLTIAYDAGFNRPVVITVLGSTYSGRFSDVLALVKAVNKQVQ